MSNQLLKQEIAIFLRKAISIDSIRSSKNIIATFEKITVELETKNTDSQFFRRFFYDFYYVFENLFDIKN